LEAEVIYIGNMPTSSSANTPAISITTEPSIEPRRKPALTEEEELESVKVNEFPQRLVLPNEQPERDLVVVARRKKRQVAPIAVNRFKGVIQDFQLSDGDSTRLIQFFPISKRNEEIGDGVDDRSTMTTTGATEATTTNEIIQSDPESLPTLGSPQLNEVRPGVVLDPLCDSNPCLNGGACSVLFQDFSCNCTAGFKVGIKLNSFS
jgi:hypothetical protein